MTDDPTRPWVRVHPDADEGKSDEEFLTRNIIQGLLEDALGATSPGDPAWWDSHPGLIEKVNKAAEDIAVEFGEPLVEAKNVRGLLESFCKYLIENTDTFDPVMASAAIEDGTLKPDQEMIDSWVTHFMELEKEGKV